MNIAVIGAGHVGLVTGACLAEIGHQVFCCDSDTKKLQMLKEGQMPFFEPHLEALLASNSRAGRLEFVRTEEGIERAQSLFICVGTPLLEDGEADLAGIEEVARSIAEHARGFRLVIEKSTVPVQTGRQLEKHLASYRNNSDFQYEVASNPEFLREGSGVEDFLHPDRIVVGAESLRAAEDLQEIYRPVIEQTFTCPVHPVCEGRRTVPLVVTDVNSAELIKHAANAFLAMKISFVNMVADLCEAVGADVEKVVEAVALDPRIGGSYLRPGIGFGGFCFPKDLQAFVRIAEKFGCDFALLREVQAINSRRVSRFVSKIKEELCILRGKKIGAWGLAYKPNTDDTRFAPSLAILHRLVAEGAEVQAYDPKAIENARAEFPDVRYCSDPYEAACGVEALLLLTEWEEFRGVDWNQVRQLVSRRLFFDGRNMFSPTEVQSHGFQYIGIGRAAPRLAEVRSGR